MHDIRAIRADPAAFDGSLARRGSPPMSERVLEADKWRRDAIALAEDAQRRRNERSKAIGQAKARGDSAETERLLNSVNADIDEAAALEVPKREEELKGLLESLPNILDPDVPDGADETANLVLHQHGTPAVLPFDARQHFEIGEALGLMDFAAAAKLAGSRFTVLKGALARLERALGQWMISLHADEHGYTEVSPPLLVNDAALYGTAQLPKFAEDLFRTTDGRWLIPTAEVSLTNLVREAITPEEELPLRMTALTPCFRSEAGASGRDTRGMIRQHQFNKVELVSITTPDQSDAEHERMVECAESVLKRLELPFRTMLLCAGDMGFSARKTYDLEVWIPSEGRYREISSCSNCGDFQARRMDARCKAAGEKGTRFVHTLNGSGLAVGRTLVAVMENYQDENGRIAIPQALHPYLPGLTHIGGA